jgi:hypothetical protein
VESSKRKPFQKRLERKRKRRNVCGQAAQSSLFKKGLSENENGVGGVVTSLFNKACGDLTSKL